MTKFRFGGDENFGRWKFQPTKIIAGKVFTDKVNSIEPESIEFTKEEEKDNKLAVLDLELNVNRKKKKIEFNVHYKETNTNITIKKKSNHKESIQKEIIKGYADRARALCDPGYMEGEINNVINMFEANGFSREEIKYAMKEKEIQGWF